MISIEKHLFWDLGDAEVIHPSKEKLGLIMLGLIRCNGKLHCTYCQELNEVGDFIYKTSGCAVLFRISLPENMKEKFEEITKLTLSKPPKVGIFS